MHTDAFSQKRHASTQSITSPNPIKTLHSLAIGQVVDDGDRVASLHQLHDSVGANVARAASHKDMLGHGDGIEASRRGEWRAVLGS